MSDENCVFVLSACRTPITRFKTGALAAVSATDLGAHTIREVCQRAGIEASSVHQVFAGNVYSAGLGQNPARIAAIKAGSPLQFDLIVIDPPPELLLIYRRCVPECALSDCMSAIVAAVKSIKLQDADLIIAGGFECMSQCPFYMGRDTKYGGIHLPDGLTLDGLTDGSLNQPMGELAEQTAASNGITRDMQDDYAIQSYARAAAAWKTCIPLEVAPYKVKTRTGEQIVSEDDEYNKLNVDKMKTLATAFKKVNGTITAANASTLADGAAACLLASGRFLSSTPNLKPIAQILSYAESATSPEHFTTAPAHAMKMALDRCNMTLDEMTRVEINEAFSVTALANAQMLALDMHKVNTCGGAVSLGHPLGMSGNRLIVHLANSLSSGQFALAGICNGGGGATAIVLKKL